MENQHSTDTHQLVNAPVRRRSVKNPMPVFEIKERARAVVNDRYVRSLVDGEILPYPVSTMVLDNTKGDRKTREHRAMSARWLAILKWDYPEEYEKFIAENQQEITNP